MVCSTVSKCSGVGHKNFEDKIIVVVQKIHKKFHPQCLGYAYGMYLALLYRHCQTSEVVFYRDRSAPLCEISPLVS